MALPRVVIANDPTNGGTDALHHESRDLLRTAAEGHTRLGPGGQGFSDGEEISTVETSTDHQVEGS